MNKVKNLAFIVLLLSPLRCLASSALPAEFIDAQPRVQLYMAYAQFKMAHYAMAEKMWLHIDGPGKAEAAFNLGILYEQGLGVAADLPQAVAFYRQGAESGSRAAAYQLGLIYLNHPDFKNHPQAERWLSIAAIDGDSDAAVLLQQLTGQGGSSDPLTQVRALLAQGLVDAALEQLLSMTQTDPPNYQAITRLAWLYETGIGVPRDIDQAGQLFRQAAEAGVAEAQYALSVMLQTGVGQPQDSEKANSWLRRAAAQDYPQALQKLGVDE